MEQPHLPAGNIAFVFHRELHQCLHALFAQLLIVKLILGIQLFADALIPIALEDELAPGHRPIKGLGRGRAFADHIPQAPDGFDPPGADIPVHGFGGGPIAVKIGHNCNFRHHSHASAKALNSAWASGWAALKDSGCHCTPRTKESPGSSAASTSPSGDTAAGISPGPKALMPW